MISYQLVLDSELPESQHTSSTLVAKCVLQGNLCSLQADDVLCSVDSDGERLFFVKYRLVGAAFNDLPETVIDDLIAGDSWDSIAKTISKAYLRPP